jgi:putative ABC transport system ATP-binding protein
MGIIFQSFNLIMSLSVLDNVALPMIFCNADRATRERRAQSLLDRFGVGHVSHKIPAMLSGGQQQRVSVARSMVNDPKILLADEPTGNLDSVSTQQVMDKIDEINTFDKRTIIMVSHDASHLSYAHRVYYLKDGRILREVVNPQRKQIKPVREGETIVTELEQLARLYPYDSVETWRVKSMVNFLTQDYTLNQIARLEHAVDLLLQGRIDRDHFIKSLILPMERGGVEVTEKEARHMANVVEKVVYSADDIRRFRAKKDNDAVFFTQDKLAERLQEHLSQEHRIKMSQQQKDNMTELIADRVTGVADEAELNARLMKSVRSKGLSLSEDEADDMTRYFEKIIAQGVDVSYKL